MVRDVSISVCKCHMSLFLYCSVCSLCVCARLCIFYVIVYTTIFLMPLTHLCGTACMYDQGNVTESIESNAKERIKQKVGYVALSFSAFTFPLNQSSNWPLHSILHQSPFLLCRPRLKRKDKRELRLNSKKGGCHPWLPLMSPSFSNKYIYWRGGGMSGCEEA